jgi:hypothetical protein
LELVSVPKIDAALHADDGKTPERLLAALDGDILIGGRHERDR